MRGALGVGLIFLGLGAVGPVPAQEADQDGAQEPVLVLIEPGGPEMAAALCRRLGVLEHWSGAVYDRAPALIVEAVGTGSWEPLREALTRPGRLGMHLVVDPREPVPADALTLLSLDPAMPAYTLNAENLLGDGAIAEATWAFDDWGQPALSISFDDVGREAFARATGENVNRMLAIVVDDRVMSAPRIRMAITGGSALITGDFTPDDVQLLTAILNAGPLPAPVARLEFAEAAEDLGKDLCADRD